MTQPELPRADREMIRDRYRARYMSHGPTVAALASGTDAKQRIRHQVLSEIGSIDGATLLDVGCGIGQFYAFCRESDWQIRYTGIDLVPEFVAHCHQEFGSDDPPPAFLEADLFADSCAAIRRMAPHDFVVASQVFNNRYAFADNWELFQEAVRAMFERCARAVAVDCLTTRVDFQEPQLYYYDPARVLEFGLSLTRRAVLRHDYPLYEQTLYLYRQ